jgi:DNA polymerase V
MIFHIDGNSFYANCERLFRPDLSGKPVAVLSNNDGIIVALTQEAKAAGFKRGDVYFKVKNKLESQGVAVFSSNYTLYADISARINAVYNRYSEENEMYSIDESFLFFPAWNNADYSALANEIKETVKQEIGIPVSVGIAPAKTLAKLCNKLAKHKTGVCEWSKIDQTAALAATPAADIWGIGRAKAALLKNHGIRTALDLKNFPLDKAIKYLTINGFRTVQELNGIAAIAKVQPEARKSIIVSRGFSGTVTHIEDIIAALCEYTQEAVKRLREDRQNCRCISVFLMTGHYDSGAKYSGSAADELHKASSYLPEITKTAVNLLRRVYRAGYNYRKVLISLSNFENDTELQHELFTDTDAGIKEKQKLLMQAIDTINSRYGRGAVRQGTALLNRRENDEYAPWKMKRELLSPPYTTALSGIPKVG